MYFLYADESGDPGNNTNITTHYTLSGIMVDDANWRSLLNEIKVFRGYLKSNFNIPVRSELHATEIWRGRGIYRRLGITMADKRRLFHEIALFVRRLNDVNILVACIDKNQQKLSKVNIRTYAWKLLFQRFENFLLQERDFGIIYIDGPEDRELTFLLRKMRAYNPIPSIYGGYRRLEIKKILEDPSFRDSRISYFVQLADLVAYLARLRDNSTPAQKKWGLNKMYKALRPRFVLKANPKDPYGFKYG